MPLKLDAELPEKVSGASMERVTILFSERELKLRVSSQLLKASTQALALEGISLDFFSLKP
jgi:hypothetical protein